MSRFVQLHLLTSYPPANLNRDDLGRPKTAVMGNVPRLRVSSQSLKRAWRTSDVFEGALSEHIGTRTKTCGIQVFKKLCEKGVSEKNALTWAREIVDVFGKPKSLSKRERDNLKKMGPQEKLQKELTELELDQLAHFSPEELAGIDALIEKLANENEPPSKEDLALLRKNHKAVDIALFGRMLADDPIFNTEAAAQVAHAISVHQVTVEDDYFTAIDDLNDGSEDAGAAHLGETEFAAGLFYLYLCIDREALKENLSSDAELASKALSALIESVATVAPMGMQNSFGSRAYASYILCEKGDEQPRSLSVAFLKPITGSDILANAISGLEECREKMNSVYGIDNGEPCILNAQTGQGSIKEMLKYATEELA